MKLKYVDALRGLAILGVVSVHASQYGYNGSYPSWLIWLTGNGTMGVQLFFVASAFTLFLSMEKKVTVEKTPYLNFFIRRFFRIAPMYYIGICFYLWEDGTGQRGWLADQDHITSANIISNALFVHGVYPYWITSLVPGGWSIAVEMMFYALVPLLFLKIRNTGSAICFLFYALLFNAVTRYYLDSHPMISSGWLWQEFLFFYLPSQLPVFAFGIVLFFMIKENYKYDLTVNMILLGSTALMAQIAGLPVFQPHYAFATAFLVFALLLSKYEWKLFVNPVFMFIGKVSFSMYLVHFAVLYWLSKFNLVDFVTVTGHGSAVFNYLLRWVFVVDVCVIISAIMYYSVETPMQNVGKKLIKHLAR